ncbi:hypothetical protein IGI04_022683 [Brassica rapa subsp. trilocularis]|uniref:Uncharacterized protein n=1 Tax=Brassica rapa subsp. trilocularis TaxID=1813537 RepID=A0ABQ7M314_BRACM|nr:hypothetical protein IGI04_022683 [Brassica rapa subsp. trilocularis]
MVRGNVLASLRTSRQAFYGQNRSSSQLDGLFGFRADGPDPGQWRSVGVRPCSHGPLGFGTRPWAKSIMLGNLRSSMGDREQEKNMENTDTVQKARVAKGHELPRVLSYQRSRVTKGCEQPKGVSNQRVQVAKGYEHQEVRGPRGTRTERYEDQESQGLIGCLAYRIGLEAYSAVGSRPKAGSVKGWLVEDLGYGRQELRMVLVKPRSREGSVSERPCNVWLDDARDELVIVYETIKKLCVGSHVSK